MKKTLNFCEFCDEFSDQYKDNFTYEGKKALYSYLEEYEDETEQDIEFDPVALCCEYTEYENIQEFNKKGCDEKITVGD